MSAAYCRQSSSQELSPRPSLFPVPWHPPGLTVRPEQVQAGLARDRHAGQGPRVAIITTWNLLWGAAVRTPTGLRVGLVGTCRRGHVVLLLSHFPLRGSFSVSASCCDPESHPYCPGPLEGKPWALGAELPSAGQFGREPWAGENTSWSPAVTGPVLGRFTAEVGGRHRLLSQMLFYHFKERGSIPRTAEPPVDFEGHRQPQSSLLEGSVLQAVSRGFRWRARGWTVRWGLITRWERQRC